MAVLGLAIIATSSEAQVRKTILLINEFGQVSPVSVVVANQIRSTLHSDRRFQVEFYWENMDAIDLRMMRWMNNIFWSPRDISGNRWT